MFWPRIYLAWLTRYLHLQFPESWCQVKNWESPRRVFIYFAVVATCMRDQSIFSCTSRTDSENKGYFTLGSFVGVARYVTFRRHRGSPPSLKLKKRTKSSMYFCFLEIIDTWLNFGSGTKQSSSLDNRFVQFCFLVHTHILVHGWAG